MAKPRVVYRRAKSHRRSREEKTAPHSILATVFGAGAALLPIAQGTASYMSPLQYAAAAAEGDTAAAGDIGPAFLSSLSAYWLDMLGLGIASAAVGWGGKKYAKSATNVSRKWRVI